MHFPASYWTCLAFFALTGMLCRRWPALALHGASCAFCDVFRAMLSHLSYHPLVVLLDALLFVLPTAALVRACGSSDEYAIGIGILVPWAMGADAQFGSEFRSTLLAIGTGAAQGFSAVFGVQRELGVDEPSPERRIAIVVAGMGLFGIAFREVWSDVAWTGAVAHAFACLVYLADEQSQ